MRVIISYDCLLKGWILVAGEFFTAVGEDEVLVWLVRSWGIEHWRLQQRKIALQNPREICRFVEISSRSCKIDATASILGEQNEGEFRVGGVVQENEESPLELSWAYTIYLCHVNSRFLRKVSAVSRVDYFGMNIKKSMLYLLVE